MFKTTFLLAATALVTSLCSICRENNTMLFQATEPGQQYGGGKIVYLVPVPYGTPNEGYAPTTQIGIVNPDGSRVSLLTTHQPQNHYNDFSPVFSPDGRYIAFDSALTSTFDPNVRGTFNILDLTSGKTIAVGKDLDTFLYFRWRPDSKALLYETEVSTSSGDAYKYHIVNVGGTNDQIFPPDSLNIAISDLSWSPDGEHFLYFMKSLDPNSAISGENWVISDLDGSNQRIVGTANENVGWYPVGYSLTVNNTDTGTIQIVDADSGKVLKIVSYPHDYPHEYIEYKWSPDGRYLAFYPQPDNNLESHIDVLDSTTNQIRRLDKQPGSYEYLSWSPNSHYLVVSARLMPGISSGLYIFSMEDSSMTTLLPSSSGAYEPDWSKENPQ